MIILLFAQVHFALANRVTCSEFLERASAGGRVTLIQEQSTSLSALGIKDVEGSFAQGAIDFFYSELKPTRFTAATTTGAPRSRFLGEVTQVVPAGDKVLVVGKNGDVLRLHDGKTLAATDSIEAQALGVDFVRDAWVSADRRRLAITGPDNLIRLIEMSENWQVASIKITGIRGRPTAYLGRDCVVLTDDGAFMRVDATGATVSVTPEGAFVDPARLFITDAHTATQRLLFVDGARLKVVDLSRPAGRSTVVQVIPELIRRAAFSTGGDRVAFVGMADDIAQVRTVGVLDFDWSSGGLTPRLVFHSRVASGTDELAQATLLAAGDGWIVASFCETFGLRLFALNDSLTQLYRKELKVRPDSISLLDIDGHALLTIGEIRHHLPDAIVRHWLEAGPAWAREQQVRAPAPMAAEPPFLALDRSTPGRVIDRIKDSFEIPFDDELARQWDGRPLPPVPPQGKSMSLWVVKGPDNSTFTFSYQGNGPWKIRWHDSANKTKGILTLHESQNIHLDPESGLVPRYESGILLYPIAELSGFVRFQGLEIAPLDSPD